MNARKTIVFFGAHPDDETFGPGATLAQYALAGVKVYCVCVTRGEAGTVDAKYMQGFASIADVRMTEMACAAKALGLAGVKYLGYRDSGMPGSPDNSHPDALTAAPVEQVAGRMVRVIRELKPDVIITHDAGGGYGHPDHVAVHNAVVKAFQAAGVPCEYPESGTAFQPGALFFTVRPRGAFRLAIKLMPLLGQDPKHYGRNKDIDLTKMAEQEYPVHAGIRLTRRALEMRNEASACHASQGGGRSRSSLFRILGMAEKLRGAQDCFMRAYPPPAGRCAKDLLDYS